LKYLRI